MKMKHNHKKEKIPWEEILRRLKGMEDAESAALLTAWLDESPLNREVYEELASLWEAVGRDSEDFDADAAWAQVKEITIGRRAAEPVKTRPRFGRWAYGAACAAAAVLFMAAGYYAAGFRPDDSLSIEKYSPLRGKSMFRLSDGTDVCLRDGSSISLKESQATGCREVFLEGEAYFHVARKEGRPFVVRAGEVEIAVHGTEFNVREEKPSGDIIVALKEGSVSLENGKRSVVMRPGDIVRCSADGEVSSWRGDVLRENCWANSSLEFRGWTLGDVCGCLSRWYDVRIDVMPEIAGRYKFNFTLRGESLDEILSMMALTSPIRFAFRLDGSVQIMDGK